jgi:RNA polymerase sigma-70 factor, ECF subfamily
MDRPDEELLANVAGGDVASLRELYERYRVRLMTYAYYAVGNRTAAEDLLQEAFIRIYRHAGEFEPGKRFSAWAYAITANLCRDELRKSWRRRRLGFRADVDANEVEAPSRAISPRAAAAGSEFRDRLGAEVAALPPEQREVITLRFLEALSYAEIAGVIGCPLGTVQSRIHAGVKALRERLGEFR